jgi:hypothetical protein
MSTYEERQAIRDANPGVIVDESSVYNPSTGQEQSIGSFTGGDGGGGGGGGGGAVDLSGIMQGFAASAGFSIKQLEEQARQFNESLNWQKQMWANQGLPQLAIQQRAQDLEEQKFGELTTLARQQQSWVEEIGKRQAALAEKSQAEANAIAQGNLGVAQGQLAVQQGQLGLQEQGLGLDVLNSAAKLSGPSNWIQAANFNRGVAETQLPEFIRRLQSGQGTALLGGPALGAQQSQPLTLATLAQGMGVPAAAGIQQAPSQLGTTATNQQATANAQEQALQQAMANYQGQGLTPEQLAVAQQNQAGITNPVPSMNDVDYAAQKLRQIYGAGGQALGPQQLEGLTPTEQQMFVGGGGAVGADVEGYLDQYKRSRIGQQSALPG